MQPTTPLRRIGLPLGLLLASQVLVANTQPQPAIHLVGSGASFPAPLIEAMAMHYQGAQRNGVTIQYHAIGSGAGIRQFLGQEVMFGLTEAFLPDATLTEVRGRTRGEVFHLPITLADVVPTYNLPGVESGVVFSGELLADIYLGQITRWDDKRIQALNPNIQLPNLPITVIYRSDASGTTNILTSFLNAVSKRWAERVGRGTLVSWPVGQGANGNEGVTNAVMATPGGIGYNSFAFALLHGMSYGWVINRSGNTIEPSLAATSEAANIDLPPDTRVLFTNTSAPNGYPIAGFSWLLVHEHLDQTKAIATRAEAEALVHFLIWAITNGQDLSEMLGYARLPQVAVRRAMHMIERLTWRGEPIGRNALGKVTVSIP